MIPENSLVTIPSLQFENATIANIDSKFGSNSASALLYRKIFSLYDNAPGVASASDGDFINPVGCPPDFNLLGVGVPCVRHFISERGLASQDTLTSGRVDWNVSGNDRVFLQIQNDRGHVPAYVDFINPVFDVDGSVPSWQGQVVWTRTFGSSAANQFLLAGGYLAPFYGLKHSSQALAAFPTTLGFASSIFNGIGGLNGDYALPISRINAQYQISDDLVKTRGNHKFELGTNFERTYWTDRGFAYLTAGGLSVQTLDAFYQGGVDPASPKTDFTTLAQSFASDAVHHLKYYNFALYAQDEWHAQPNLTITLALRAEHQSNPICETRCFARMAGPFASVSHDPNQPYNQAILINQRQASRAWTPYCGHHDFSFAWQPLGVSHNTVLPRRNRHLL